MAVSIGACTSHREQLEARGVIVGVEAHIPQRPVSITLRTEDGRVLVLLLAQNRNYGSTVSQMYEWVDGRRPVLVTYSRRDGSYVLDSMTPLPTTGPAGGTEAAPSTSSPRPPSARS